MENIKIAIILSAADLDNRKGYLNAVHNRIANLQKVAKFQIDVYALCAKNAGFFRLLKGNTYVPADNIKYVDDVKYHFLPYPLFLFDYIVDAKFKLSRLLSEYYLKKYIYKFTCYDLLIPHSTEAAVFANKVYSKYKIPYLANWHGSDIHSRPLRNKYTLQKTQKLISEALYNIYVSKNLESTGKKLVKKQHSTIIYNGVSSDFYKLDNQELLMLRKQNLCEGKKVIAFVGDLREIKNVRALPEIFSLINKDVPDCLFWIIGDGKLRDKLYSDFVDTGINFKMYGNIKPKDMPRLYNCIKLLILPSLNEGLPLVTVEALKSGCNVIGSNVGGIPEVLGSDNVFELNNNFRISIATRGVKMLQTNIEQQLSKSFNWKISAAIELELILKILNSLPLKK